MRRAVLICGLMVGLICNAVAEVEVQCFFTEGCYKCRELKELLAKIEYSFSNQVMVSRLEITDLANYKRMMELEKKHGITRSVPMEAFVGESYLLGHDEILGKLEHIVSKAVMDAGNQPVKPVITPVDEHNSRPTSVLASNGLFKHMKPLVVAGAGFTDGINPCAFATIVFMISLLTMRKFSHNDVIIAGLTFSAAVFLTYFLMGLGAFKILHRLTIFHMLSSLLYWLIVAGVIVLGVLSLKDAWIYLKTGSTGETVLKIPDSSRNLMHQFMRDRMSTQGVIAGSFAAGVVVSLLEVVCTGQIYLPTIMVMLQDTSSRHAGLGYLLLYNTMFIIPLLIVLILVLLGVKLEVFLRFSKSSFIGTKIALAVLFLALAIILILLRLSL